MSDANAISDLERAEHKGFSDGLGAKRVIPYLANGDGTYSDQSGSEFATKVTVSGTTTYVAQAAIGSAQSSAVWRAKKIDESSGTVITWADGNANFDNQADDLASLSYS